MCTEEKHNASDYYNPMMGKMVSPIKSEEYMH